MKKLISIFTTVLFAFSLIISFSSCNDSKEQDSKDKDTEYLLRIKSEVGDNYDITFLVEMGGAMEMNMEMNFFSKVLSVDGDETDFKMGFTKAKMSMSMQGETINYDSENPYESEQSTAMHSEIKDLFGAELGMTMDSKGKVLKEYGFEDLGADFAGQMGFANVEYPEHALKIGDSFDYSIREEGMAMDATYTLTNVSDSEYTLSITGDIVGEGSGEVTGEIILFRECGMPKTSNLKMEMDVMGQKMDMTLSLNTSKR